MRKLYQTKKTVQTNKVMKASFVRYLMILALLLGVAGTALGQDLYIIHNGNNYLSHNASSGAVNTTRVTTFDPTTCFWIISGNYLRPVNSSGEVLGNLYLRPRSGNYTYSLNTNTSTNYASWNGLSDGGQPYYNRYLRLNNNTWEISNTNNNRGTLRLVTVTPVSATSTNPTISGADVLTATGNSTYNASGAAYQQGGYTDYYFNSAHHYFNGNTSITPATATISGYSWSISSDADVSASGTTYQGSITVNTLPETDMPATITVTVTFTGGTPAVDANTTITGTKDIIIQGTKPSAPIISVSGTTVTLSTTAAGSTTIRYTTDGSEPTTSTGTVYSGTPIDLSGSATSPVTIKAITVRNGVASDMSTEVVTLTLPAPTITANAAAGTATISTTAGATIHYTTDGSTPTTSSLTYSGSISGLTMMQTIKAIAVKDGWNNSPIASETLRIPSGVSGSTVTLFDYEDHSWSYYSDPDCPIRSLSPADVKITYYGDGIVMSNNDNYTAGTNNYVSPGNANYEGGAAVNVGGEDENTFIYYKTLERGANTQTAYTFSSGSQSAAESRCPYTTIPNPFQVRPTYGSRGTTDANNFTGWRGFQCWRLKSVSGGAVYSVASGGTALAVNAIINGETEIYFAPNSEYGMEVELEAVWARAYLVKGNQGGANNILSQNVGVERNFLILTAGQNYRFDGTNGRYIGNKGYAVTISNYYPNGEAPDNTNSTISGYNNMTLGADTKFENVTFNSMGSYTLTAANHSLIVGRGCSGTVNYVRGADGNETSLNYTLRLESGTYNYVSLIKGYWTGSNNYTDNGSTMSGNLDLRSTLGCDYDRATNSGITENFKIVNNFIVGAGNTIADANKHRNTTNVTVKSGKIGTAHNITSNNSYTADAYQSMYMSVSNSQQTIGQRKVFIEGGELIGIAGGIDAHYLGSGVTNNNVTGIPTPHTEEPSFTVRMIGGNVRGCVYGGAAKSPASGNRRMVFTGGTINGWVGCGCNGTEDDGGKTYGESFLYFGGNTRCEAAAGHDYEMNGTKGGYVFGAGKGYAGGTGTSGEMTYGTNFAIADNSYIQRDAFGGGNYGYALESTNVFVSGGTVEGNVFGGSNLKDGPTVSIETKGNGIIHGGLYGGSNETGNVSVVTMNINGGTIGDGDAGDGVFGGGLGNATRIIGNVNITLGENVGDEGATVNGDVYGGSAQGKTNCNTAGTARTAGAVTNVTLNAGTINGSLYGGGLGTNSYAADVWGPVQVKVYGGSVRKTDANGANGSGGVYGCNNVNGAPQNTVAVDIYGTDDAPSANEYALFAVYGGGNQASYAAGTPTVKVHNCDNSIEYVYGGGNAAHITHNTNGNTDVTIYGGNKIGTVFGGGNGTVTAANVSGNTNVKIYGGTILHVFGGSNERGSVGGSINVNVNKQADTDPEGSATACDMIVGEVYGGGNLAASAVGNITIGCTGSLTADHSDHPDNIGVTLEGIGSVYGGANQANISGDITLTMNSGIVGNLFGGNNTSGTISGGIQVDVLKDNGATCASDWYLGNVFGGGNLAQYTIPNAKALAVNILNGTVSGNVYGGGKGLASDHTKGQVTGNPVVTIGDDAAGSPHTGYQAIVLGDVYGGGDAGNVEGTPQVNVVKKCNTNVANVYGGGNAADVSATDVNIDGGVIGNVYGGGHGDKTTMPQKEANVSGDVDVTVTGGTITKVFGGSNSKGTISGDITLTVEKGGNSCDMHITEVYGGGNEAAGNAGLINIVCTGSASEGIEYVYGGANQADVTSDIALTITGGRITQGVFGGNNTSGSISGTITVDVEWDNSCAQNYLYNVYGGGNLAPYTASSAGYPAVNIKNGTVSNNVYGGGKGASAVVTGSPVVTIGDNNGSHSAIVNGDVYGGGDAAAVTGQTTVIYNDNNASSTVANLFGGGNAAGVSGTTTVTLTSGKVTTGVYGGCNSSGTVGGAVAVNINGGTVGANASHAFGVYGGGYGTATGTGDAVTVTVGDGSTTPVIYGDVYGGSAKGNVNDDGAEITKVWLQSGTVHGDIYGGGYGEGGSNALVNGSVQVVIDGGTLVADATSGGRVFGCNNANGTPKGTVTVTVNATDATIVDGLGAKTYALKSVFGGGNLAAYDPTDPSDKCLQVIINGCATSIDTVYGGGNAAPVPQTDVTINGGDIRCVFAGGNGSSGTPANVGYNNKLEPTTANSYGVGTASVTIVGGTIVDVFGGSNAHGVIREGNSVNITGGGSCPLNLTNVYGGGNEANGGSGTLTIDCTDGGLIDYVYGGANRADVDGDIELNIVGGRIEHVFGGNNASGVISGSITVNVEWDALKCDNNYLGYVYGGGNLAAYTAPTGSPYTGNYPIVNIKNGTVTHDVFGGGYGAGAIVTGNPVVTVGDATPGYNVLVLGNVFGGGNAAQVTGSTDVNVIHNAIVGSSSGTEGNIFGGGNAANVTVDTKVYLGNRAKIYGNVYGGGNQGEVGGDTKVIVNSD